MRKSSIIREKEAESKQLAGGKRMENTIKMGKGVLFWLGIIYAILGGIFVVVGISVGVGLSSISDSRIIAAIFSGIGGIFLVLGIVFLLIEHRKNRAAQYLIERGHYIIGEVSDCQINYNIRLNNRHPFIAIVRYLAPDGTVHLFKSRNIYQYPDPAFWGRPVKIYVDGDDFRHYYVDTEEFLSNIIEH